MKSPQRIETSRLILRKPVAADAEAIFARYASDPEVTRLLGWPRHQSLEQTRAFLAFSDAEWERRPCGPYLIQARDDDSARQLGSTGLAFESPEVAATGYVLARDAWGLGYATEALAAIVVVARQAGVRRLYALCHPDNAASIHVLEKCGFFRECLLPQHSEFPNLDDDAGARRRDCLRFAILETDRLVLAPWQNADWTAFRPIATNPEVMRYITGGAPWSDEQIQAFVERQRRLYAERGFCRWKLLLKDTGSLAGFCGVGYWRDGLEPEIGWWLAPQYWGLGLATEAARVALRDAFERVGLERVVSIAMTGNTASRRIMAKLGLASEHEFESDGVRLVQYAIGRGTKNQEIWAADERG